MSAKMNNPNVYTLIWYLKETTNYDDNLEDHSELEIDVVTSVVEIVNLWANRLFASRSSFIGDAETILLVNGYKLSDSPEYLLCFFEDIEKAANLLLDKLILEDNKRQEEAKKLKEKMRLEEVERQKKFTEEQERNYYSILKEKYG